MAAEVKNTEEYTSEFGNKYTFQKVLPSKWVDVIDRADLGGGRQNRKILFPAVLESVVVVPSGLKMDDFAEEGRGGYAEMDEVVYAAIRFQRG